MERDPGAQVQLPAGELEINSSNMGMLPSPKSAGLNLEPEMRKGRPCAISRIFLRLRMRPLLAQAGLISDYSIAHASIWECDRSHHPK
jgi:hypothetical protein